MKTSVKFLVVLALVYLNSNFARAEKRKLLDIHPGFRSCVQRVQAGDHPLTGIWATESGSLQLTFQNSPMVPVGAVANGAIAASYREQTQTVYVIDGRANLLSFRLGDRPKKNTLALSRNSVDEPNITYFAKFLKFFSHGSRLLLEVTEAKSLSPGESLFSYQTYLVYLGLSPAGLPNVLSRVETPLDWVPGAQTGPRLFTGDRAVELEKLIGLVVEDDEETVRVILLDKITGTVVAESVKDRGKNREIYDVVPMRNNRGLKFVMSPRTLERRAEKVIYPDATGGMAYSCMYFEWDESQRKIEGAGIGRFTPADVAGFLGN